MEKESIESYNFDFPQKSNHSNKPSMSKASRNQRKHSFNHYKSDKNDDYFKSMKASKQSLDLINNNSNRDEPQIKIVKMSRKQSPNAIALKKAK